MIILFNYANDWLSVDIQGASNVLQQILMTKSIAYKFINFFFPVFHEDNKPISKIANKPV